MKRPYGNGGGGPNKRRKYDTKGYQIVTRPSQWGRQRNAHVRAWRRRREDLRDLMRAWWMVRRYLVVGKVPPKPRK